MQLSPQKPVAQGPIDIPQDVPVYTVMDEKGFFADDELFPQGAIIPWDKEPNPLLDPMNELADLTMQEYLAKLDKFGMDKAKKDGVSYMSQLDAYNRRRAADVADQGPQRTRDLRTKDLRAKKQIPLMQAKKEGKRAVDLSKGDK